MRDATRPGGKTISTKTFLTIYAVLVVALLLLGQAYPEARFRIEAHEQAHLRAYRLQGIEAERSSFRLVRSAALTNLGVLAGYRRDITNIFVGGLLSALAAGFLYVSWRRNPFLSVLPVWTISAWPGIRKEMLLPALDIRNAAELTGRSMSSIVSAVTFWALLVIIVLLAVCFLTMTWPALWAANETGQVGLGRARGAGPAKAKKKTGRWGRCT